MGTSEGRGTESSGGSSHPSLKNTTDIPSGSTLSLYLRMRKHLCGSNAGSASSIHTQSGTRSLNARSDERGSRR